MRISKNSSASLVRLPRTSSPITGNKFPSRTNASDSVIPPRQPISGEEICQSHRILKRQELYHAWSIPLALGSYLIGGAIVGISGYLLTSALGLPWYLSLLAGIGTAYFVLTSSRRLIADRFCPWVFFGSGPESTPLLDWINELAKRDLKTHRAIAFLPTYYFVLNNHIQLIEKYFQIQSQTGKASQFILYKISTGLKLNIPKPSPGNTDNSSLMEEVKQMLLMKKQHLNRMRIELLALINEVYQSEVLDHDRLQDLIVQTRTFLNPD